MRMDFLADERRRPRWYWRRACDKKGHDLEAMFLDWEKCRRCGVKFFDARYVTYHSFGGITLFEFDENEWGWAE